MDLVLEAKVFFEGPPPIPEKSCGVTLQWGEMEVTISEADLERARGHNPLQVGSD